MTTASTSWLRAHRRGLRRGAFAFAILYAVYLVAANMFLNSALGERIINRKPGRYHAQWTWAMSLYPGHIHARGVVMGGHARTNRWTVASPRADGRIKLLPLLWREVAFGTIRARDVSVHVARTPDDMPTTKRPGRAPWTLRFDAITTPSLLRFDFYEARVTGHGKARFVFEKQLQGGAMAVGRSTLEMPDATLHVGDVALLRQGALTFEIAMPAHIREQAQGAEKLVLLDARMRVDGPAPGIDLVARNDDALPIGAAATSGHLRADLALERGVLMPGSRLDWSAPVFSRGADGTALRHPLGVALRTAPDAIAFAARVPAPAAGAPWLRADLRVDDRRLGPDDWLRPVRAVAGTVETQWPAVPLRWIDLMLDDVDWLAFDGRADLDAALALQQGRLRAGSRIDVRDARLRARVLDNRFEGAAHAAMRLDEADGGEPRTTIAIAMDRFTLAPEATPARIDLEGRDLRLDLAATGPLAEFHEHLDARLRFEDAQVPDLRSFNRYLPGDSARLLGGSGQASGDLRLDNAGEMASGRMQVRGRGVRLALGPSRLTGDVALDSRLTRMQKVGRRYTIDALAVTLDGVRLEEASRTQAPPWWARLALEQGTLDWREPFEVSGRGRVDMRDVSVLLGLFAERRVLPRWIGNLVDAGQVHATGDLRVRGNELVFDRIAARNDRVDLQARLRIADGRPHGDLYARWGILGLGVELQDGERTLHIAGARDWYEGRPPLLPR
ncbi:hypothetical protein [Luteimonas sp. FCS-9]|uniref:hypothetical protein n=1 Tax=Luteimonas sp. FCS-9 TaxID=1547516 RepID=UPI00063EB2AC|nr:hypothetical protein [Luteimonas sp. FCS-9]KLJ02410.1 hypothetical protein WQ56_02395 [Luteimonas sp. FCS-9]